MTITSHQIHSVLRTYGKQLRRGLKLNRIRQIDEGEAVDQVRISSEAKRRQVVEQVASEILLRMTDPAAQSGDVQRRIVRDLSEELGTPVQLAFNENDGLFDINLLDPETGRASGRLEGEDRIKTNNRLVEIARKVVDETTLKGKQ